MREAREYLALHPACELCGAEDLIEAATVAGWVETDDPDVLRPVAVCEVHRLLVMVAPPAG